MLWTADPLFVWIAAACTSTLLAHAAIVKLADLDLWRQHLAAYGMPANAQRLAAAVVPGAEAIAGVLLLTPWRIYGAVLAASLLLLYAVAMASLRLQGRTPDCGCGGEPLPVSWALVGRNVVLAALAVLASAPMAERALGGADYLVVVAAVVLAGLIYAAFHQVLRHRAAPRATTALWRT